MSTFEVELRFTGLCGFVKHPTDSRMRVLLVNELDGSHVPHEAVLLVDKANLQRPSPPLQPNFKFIDDFDRNATLHAFRLRGVDLAFPPDSVSPGFDFRPARTQPQCPITTDEHSFGWIARMDTVGAGYLKDEVFGTSSGALILARMLLTGGHFTTVGFRAAKIGSDLFRVRWQFKDQQGTTVGSPQAIAEEVSLHFSVSDTSGSWGLDFTKFGGETDRLLLDPYAGLVRLWLVNMPLLNILGAVSGNPLEDDTHFLSYYRLSSAGQYIPSALPPHCSIGAGGLTGPKCPPVLFNDHGLA